jgi:hypothetical protein
VLYTADWCKQFVEALRYKPGHGFDFPMVSLRFFIDLFLPAAILTLESAQHLTDMSTRKGKGGRYVGLTTLPPSCADYLEILKASTSWGPRGLSRPVQSAQHLTDMSTRRGKGGRCVGQTTLPPSCADCLEILRASRSWGPRGLSRPLQGLLCIQSMSDVVLTFKLCCEWPKLVSVVTRLLGLFRNIPVGFLGGTPSVLTGISHGFTVNFRVSSLGYARAAFVQITSTFSFAVWGRAVA